MDNSGVLSGKRAVWVYLSLALMALPLADGYWAVPWLLHLPAGPSHAAVGIISVAVVLLVWLEWVRRAAQRNWPTWPLVLWPLSLLALWALGVSLSA